MFLSWCPPAFASHGFAVLRFPLLIADLKYCMPHVLGRLDFSLPPLLCFIFFVFVFTSPSFILSSPNHPKQNKTASSSRFFPFETPKCPSRHTSFARLYSCAVNPLSPFFCTTIIPLEFVLDLSFFVVSAEFFFFLPRLVFYQPFPFPFTSLTVSSPSLPRFFLPLCVVFFFSQEF